MSEKQIPRPGQRFGMLVVLDLPPQRGRGTKWACHCDCGNQKFVTTSHLWAGAVRSCGCQQQAMRAEFGAQKTTHGGSESITFKRWRSMRARCNLPNTKSYARYGGRGITICERWEIFDNFLEDMGPCPTPEMTLERKDSNGNYTPDNCEWADRKTQNRNTSRNVNLTHDGETLCVAEWAEKLGLNYRTIMSRLARGEATEQALRPAQMRSARKDHPS